MGKIYVVRQGDTLNSIAAKFGIAAAAVAKANNILNPDLIYAGQKLVIPPPVLPAGIYGPNSRGEGVRAIQNALIYMGFALPADGVYTGNTAEFIKSIQQKYPELLKADGIYGPKTRAVMQELLNKAYQIVQNPSSLLVLVNKTRALPPSYVPGDLAAPNIPAAAGFRLRAEAAKALEALFAKAKEDRIPLYAVSGYRPYERQAALFASNIMKAPNANLISARPGESEHQLGLAADVSAPSVNFALTEDLGNTPEGKWLQANAPNFGFIIRYPKGGEAKTGYSYEPWHLRYVGKDAARKITASKAALEDYVKT